MSNEIIVICVLLYRDLCFALLIIVMLIGLLYWVNVVAYKHEMNKIVKEKEGWLKELEEDWVKKLEEEFKEIHNK